MAPLLTNLTSMGLNYTADYSQAATYYEHYDRGWDLVDPDGSVTARKALGLATSPPEYDEETERDPDGGGMQV